MQKEIFTGFQKGRMSSLSDGSGFVFPYCHLGSFRVRLVFLHRQNTGMEKVCHTWNTEQTRTEQDIEADISTKNSRGNIYNIECIEEETSMVNLTESSEHPAGGNSSSKSTVHLGFITHSFT